MKHFAEQRLSEGEVTMAERAPRRASTMMPLCPMAKMCTGMMEKRPSGVLLMVPGFALIGVGVLIAIQPAVLAWLVAAASLALGGMLLVIAVFIRRFAAQLRT